MARDEAFCFYYEENLRLLEKMGARLVEFSPLRDPCPPEADGLLLGGGYPELYGRELEGNRPMRESIRALAEAGLPVMAECGGFMYLKEETLDRVLGCTPWPDFCPAPAKTPGASPASAIWSSRACGGPGEGA